MVGCNQRAARADADREVRNPSRGSILVWFLSGLWAWGLMSSQLLQKIAERALADLDYAMESDANMRSIRKDWKDLADIGDGGKYANNCSRDLRTLWQVGTATSILTYIRLPLDVAGEACATGITMYKQALLLPHVLFATLGNKFPLSFERTLCPSRDRLEEFWTNVSGSAQLKGRRGPASESSTCAVTLYNLLYIGNNAKRMVTHVHRKLSISSKSFRPMALHLCVDAHGCFSRCLPFVRRAPYEDVPCSDAFPIGSAGRYRYFSMVMECQWLALVRYGPRAPTFITGAACWPEGLRGRLCS